MKIKKHQFALVLFLFFIASQNIFSQEEPRYEITLNLEYSGVKSKMKVSNLNYSLSNYVYGTAELTAETKPEPTYLTLTISEVLNKDLIKFFEIYKRKANGFIEIKDNFGKNPNRKIEFKNASLIVSENLSTYNSGNSSSITIYSDSIIIDGANIFNK